MDISEFGLVLEGGGMRGVFTAGVLEYLLEKEIYFPYVIAVSAGASNGISYVTRQKGRARFGNIDLLKLHPYVGLKHFVKGHGVIDLDYIFYKYPDEYFPLDFEAYKKSKDRFVVVTTDSNTGEACYFEEKMNEARLVDILRASCSLPILCPMGQVDGRPMVDGGMSDPIPVHKAVKDGYKKLVIVLTRNKGYRKEEKEVNLPFFIYKKYPKLKDDFNTRSKKYNEAMDYIDELERKGDAIVIRPEKPLEVGRVEKDVDKLIDLYDQGWEEAKAKLDKLNL